MPNTEPHPEAAAAAPRSAPATPPRPAAPLLPAVLTQPSSNLWFWALPIGVLLLLNLHGYGIVEGNMDAGQRSLAHTFGALGAVNFLAAWGMFFLSRSCPLAGRRPDPAHPAWALPIVVLQVAYLWLALSWKERILPATVTVWIYPPERFAFHQLTFAMVPLAVGALRLACARPPRHTGPAIAVSLLAGVGAPVALYMIIVTAGSLAIHGRVPEILFAVAFVVLGLAMFVGVMRAIMLVLRAARRWGAVAERVAIVLIALVMPLGGLLLNRKIPFPVDLQGWEVYTLVAVNTAFLLLASWKAAAWPHTSLLLLGGSFPFTLYFFVVFLPYTPLSIFAVLALGVGFLVLTPTFLFTLHLHLLHRAWTGARAAGGRPGRVGAAALAATLVLPGFFAVRALADRAALHAALAHVTEPVISGSALTYDGSRLNLRRAIRNHREFKHGIYYPILSDAYAWLVFDSLVLPDETLDRLEEVFFGAIEPMSGEHAGPGFTDFFGTTGRARARVPRADPPSRTVAVRALDLHAAPAAGGITEATLRLTLENTGDDARPAAEYVQALPLPPGVVVSGFRLHIDGVAVPGRIFERKTALWVYSMIRDSERRDPGLLLHTAPDALELRVFPINPGKPVTVELDFLLHTGDAAAGDPASAFADSTLDPAAALAALAARSAPARVAAAGQDDLATGLDRLALPQVARPPYVHVLVDRSAEHGYAGDAQAAWREIAARWPEAREIRVTLVNHDVRDLVGPHTAPGELRAVDSHLLDATLARAGGFALDPALARVLCQHRDHDLDTPHAGSAAVPPRPVVVILSQRADQPLPEWRIAGAWLDLAPDLEIHAIGSDGSHALLRAATARTVALVRAGGTVRCVVAERAVRFPASTAEAPLQACAPEAASWLPIDGMRRVDPALAWARAMKLQLCQQDHDRSPGDPAHSLRSLVAASRQSGILVPATSYIAVENQAQWRMLELGEARKLGQQAALEFLETPAPSATLLAGGFGLWLLLRRARRPALRGCLRATPPATRPA